MSLSSVHFGARDRIEHQPKYDLILEDQIDFISQAVLQGKTPIESLLSSISEQENTGTHAS